MNNLNKKAMICLKRVGEAMLNKGFSIIEAQVFILQILFCSYCEATGLFLGRPFTHAVLKSDAADLANVLNNYFRKLPPLMDIMLFRSLSDDIKRSLGELCRFEWISISPIIFGSIYLETMSVLDPFNTGSHYTSQENINKTIYPLFLQQLQAEVDGAAADDELLEIKNRLHSIKFLDPACGSGNFLLTIFQELRLLEEQINAKLGRQGFEVNINQFYGIDFNETAIDLSKINMFLINRISEVRFAQESLAPIGAIDMDYPKNIVCANAVQLDWNELVPSSELSYIIGNPPFIAKFSEQQRNDMKLVFSSFKNIDYSAAWIKKAAEYIQGTDIEVGLILTNSVVQGNQVAQVWKPLIEQMSIQINFAHQSFQWETDLERRVQIYCVIIGFAVFPRERKVIYYYDNYIGQPKEKTVKHINAYLYPGKEIFLQPFINHISSEHPSISYGRRTKSKSFCQKEMLELTESGKYVESDFVKFITCDDMLNNRVKYILRTENDSSSTDYIIIPRHSSELRKYLPILYFKNQHIAANETVLVISNADLYTFGILCSRMHQAWTERVCGRLIMRIRYSSAIYSNFPFPIVSESDKFRVSQLAENILTIRSKYSSMLFGDLYADMPSDLHKAHLELDMFIESLYRSRFFLSDEERVNHLIDLFLENQKNETFTLGEKLRQLRIGKGYCLREVEAAIGKPGNWLGAYEKNVRKPTEKVLRMLAEFYGIGFEEVEKYLG